MTQSSHPPRQPQRTALILTVLLGMIATAVAYFGSWEKPQPPPSTPVASVGSALAIETIVLPYDEQELPPGPHQRTFATSCTICHSTRLVMTQPPFPRKKWAEVVQKMIKTYGAPINPDAAEQIADYLVTVRGQ